LRSSREADKMSARRLPRRTAHRPLSLRALELKLVTTPQRATLRRGGPHVARLG